MVLPLQKNDNQDCPRSLPFSLVPNVRSGKKDLDEPLGECIHVKPPTLWTWIHCTWIIMRETDLDFNAYNLTSLEKQLKDIVFS